MKKSGVDRIVLTQVEETRGVYAFPDLRPVVSRSGGVVIMNEASYLRLL